ncbi:MAG: fatty acid desaturase [Myxococcota bacterium]
MNLVLLAAMSAAAGGALWVASHGGAAGLVAGAVGFSFVNHGLFALLHEAVHGGLHPDPRVNRWAGRFAAAWFPTGFALQRALHLNHHHNNRGPFEQFDVLRPTDVRWLKLAQWYAILTGVYWLFAPALALVFALAPGVLRSSVLRRGGLADQTSASAFLGALDGLGPVARLEAAGALAFHVGLYVALDADPLGWAACWGAFALNWSSLQYADHAYSPLDRDTGAWDLRTPTWVRWVLLNYPLHRAHHLHPSAPWTALPGLVEPGVERPSWLGMVGRMWLHPPSSTTRHWAPSGSDTSSSPTDRDGSSGSNTGTRTVGAE